MLDIRRITPEDKPLLVAHFERLGEQSRYQRFLGSPKCLSSTQLKYLTEVDHHSHEALIALAPGGAEIVGVARYVLDPSNRDEAEVAIAIVDDWQGRGVGTALLRRLADRAREEGIATFTATCLASNRAILALFRRLGETSVVGAPTAGTVDVRVQLSHARVAVPVPDHGGRI